MDWLKCDFSNVLKESEEVLRQCFQDFTLDQVFLSFNGGKDCTLLLDITLNVLRQTFPEADILDKLKILCIRTKNQFSELDEFIRQVGAHYNVKLTYIEGELKNALAHVLEEDRDLKACLMGTRRTDPYSEHLKFIQETDPGWPRLLRVSPLLNWSYHEIWSYILERKVPYCSLYNKGYTSIGSTLNTWPNPSLLIKPRPCSCVSYKPAWHLVDGALERAGRGTKPSELSNGTTNGSHHENSPSEQSLEANCKHGGDTNV